MSEARHTPGPWTVWKGHLDVYAGEPSLNNEFSIQGRVGDLKEIAHCAPGYHSGDIELSEAVANARLIAAAPDLLAACETAMKCLIDLAPYPPEASEGVVGIVDVVRAAIQKATGV